MHLVAREIDSGFDDRVMARTRANRNLKYCKKMNVVLSHTGSINKAIERINVRKTHNVSGWKYESDTISFLWLRTVRKRASRGDTENDHGHARVVDVGDSLVEEHLAAFDWYDHTRHQVDFRWVLIQGVRACNRNRATRGPQLAACLPLPEQTRATSSSRETPKLSAKRPMQTTGHMKSISNSSLTTYVPGRKLSKNWYDRGRMLIWCEQRKRSRREP